MIHGFVAKNVQEREITHLQYIDWPDHGIPENPQPFLSKGISIATNDTEAG